MLVLDPAQYATGTWTGRVVIPAGQQLYVNAGTTDWTLVVSGYLLGVP